MRVEKPLRKAFVAAIKRGELSCGAVGEYLSIDPATVWRWCKARGIDPSRSRKLAEARAIRRIVGEQKIGRSVLRRDAADALDTWRWKGAAELDEERDTL